VHAQESQNSLTLHDVLREIPQQSVIPKKKNTHQIKKGVSYLLTYQADDDQWYETEAIATGRWVSYCDGIRYEVETDEFFYFAKKKELRRIYR
jgi:hypothetical protein